MAQMITWFAILAVITALGVAAAFVARAYMNGTSPAAVFFKPRAEPRIEVIEQTNMDGRRKLILIRRDDVEHLIMTGGPVDVVIETGIGEKLSRPTEALSPPSATATVFTRTPRTIGQPTIGQAVGGDGT